MSYYFQNFDEQLSGVMPTNWLKTPTTPYVLTSNVWSYSPLNSMSTRMAVSKQCALNLTDVGIEWAGESFYFKVKTSIALPIKPNAPYFAISTQDFSGVYQNSAMFKCSLVLLGSGHRIMYGSGSNIFDSGFHWDDDTVYECEIALDETGNFFSIYMDENPIVENFPAQFGLVESFVIEGDGLSNTIFYIDDFQIGEPPLNIILKDVAVKDAMVVI